MSGHAMTVPYTHGMGTARKEADWPDIKDTELEVVLHHFPRAGTLQAILWRSPRPFSAAAIIRTDHGMLFVKRHGLALRTPRNLEEEHALIRHLKQEGIPVASLLETANGKQWSSTMGGPMKCMTSPSGWTCIRTARLGPRF